MARVIIVPGLAVRSYAEKPAATLADREHRVDLLPAPAWRGQETDLEQYGVRLAERFDEDGTDVDLLVGLSVGTQVAAVAAAHSDQVRRLLLIGPTLAPRSRSRWHAFRTWQQGDPHPDGPNLINQAPDWIQAGLPNILHGMASAIRVRLEEVLADVDADVTIVHPDNDLISPLDFAVDLAERHRLQLLIMPDAPHSWPVGDPDRFADLVEDLLDAWD